MKKIINNIKQNYILVISVLITGLLLGWLVFHPYKDKLIKENIIVSHEEHDHPVEDLTIWTCSMHPQIKQDKPGECPICAMDLVPVTILQTQDDLHNPDEIVMSESAASLADIHTLTVKRGKANKKLILNGKIQADERNIAELTARFGGRIESLEVNFTGQRVKRGEKLATIYSPDLVSAQHELIEALSYKESRPTLYSSARTRLNQWNISDNQVDEIEAEGKPIIYFDILSPISGTVKMRHVSAGDYVKEGTKLFQVIDLSSVWVMLDAYERDLHWITEGDHIEITIKALAGQVFEGEVSFIDPFIDPLTRVARVRVELPNRSGSLKPGMFARGELHSRVADDPGQLIIPKSAILWTGKRSVVYVKVPGRETPSFLYREIVLGAEADNRYVVAEGLEEGEIIAVNGVFKIDATAQLEGKQSMMNQEGEEVSMGHNHGQSPGNSGNKLNENQNSIKEIKVYGACGMCKTRIEKAVSNITGIINSLWDEETQLLEFEISGKDFDINRVHIAVSEVGHDTDTHRAKDEVYNNLPLCCLYERPSIKGGK